MTKQKPKVDKAIVITGILALTVVELYNLSIGNNGLYLSIFVGLIAGAMGLALPQVKFK